MKLGPVVLMGAGGLFLWSSFHGASVTGTLRDLISAKQPSGSNTQPLNATTGSSSGGGATNILGGGGSSSANQALGKVLAAPFGWSTGQEWNDLVSLWNQESGWSNTAKNPTSGAYGIPQALPPSKMGALANPPTSSASAQIIWGLNYIRQTYGDPIKAWAHEQANGWY
jgi:resuscitation-promoting factor RpfB